MIDIKPMGAPGAYEITISGRVTEDDYEKTLIPALDDALEAHDRIRVLAIVQHGTGFSIGAMLNDMKYGLANWNGFDRLALVSEVDWIARSARGLSWLIPCPVRVFEPGQEEEARRWLVESLGTIHQRDLGNEVLHVQMRGKLDPASYEHEERDMEAFLARTGSPRVLIDLRDFEGWQGLSGLPRHLSLVREHYRSWAKVAILGNATWQRMGERILRRLRAETRYFSSDQEEAAKRWLSER